MLSYVVIHENHMNNTNTHGRYSLDNGKNQHTKCMINMDTSHGQFTYQIYCQINNNTVTKSKVWL